MTDFIIETTNGRGKLTTGTTTTLINNIYLSLAMPIGSWWFDVNFGSRDHELNREKDVALAAKKAEASAREALQWLLDTKRATAVDVVTSRVNGGLVRTVTVTPAAGDPVVFEKFIPVGV